MSLAKTYPIHCPQCGHPQNVDLYDSINVAQEPALRTALLENRLNRVQCEACEANFRVDKPVLYHDADRNILIHWMPDNACSREDILDEFDSAMEELRAALPDDMEPPRVRLVFDRVELVELMFMIEAGMEERVVEYIKYTIHMQNMSRLPPATKQLLLNVQDSTAEELLFAVRNVETSELEEVLRYPRDSYRKVRDLYRQNPDELMELFPGPYISARAALMEEEAGEEIPNDDAE
ncbi:MAG: CpXC domain-containing protein [Verrucomicrobia bacterium]|nr:CpXC domain-containing protein [Verrucomicrobiota bacterium]